METPLRLSLFTDLSLRLLMYLACTESGTWIRTPEVAGAFRISVHHLKKAAQGLVRAGYIEAQPGRAGGVRLAVDPASLRIGALVAQLEGMGCLIDCHGSECPLAGACILKRALDKAERSFIRELDAYVLADVVTGRTRATLLGIVREPRLQPGHA